MTDDANVAIPESSLTGISVVMPIRNEERYLRASVSAILNQDVGQRPLEVVLAIGPSNDRTLEIAREISEADSRVRWVLNPSGKTPTALNIGIAHARYEMIVRVDGHAELPPGYIAKGLTLLDSKNAVNVGGIMAAQGRTPFESAVAAAMTSPLGVGASKFHTGGEAGEVDTVYLGMFRKSALINVGGYDERFVRAQDWELNLRLREAGGRVWFDPALRVAYRPRPNLRTLAKQYFEYGRWRHVVIRVNNSTRNLRYLAPPLTTLGFFAGLVAGSFWKPAFVIPIIYLCFLVLAALKLSQFPVHGLRALGLLVRLPVVLATMHFAWGLGYLTSPRSLLPRSRWNGPDSWPDTWKDLRRE